MYNHFTVIGHLTRDIELKYLQSGTVLGKSAIASNHNYTSNGQKIQETMYMDFEAWGKTGENMNRYLRKGSLVMLEGRVKFNTWEKDGAKYSKHILHVNSMKMLDSKKDNSVAFSQPNGTPPTEAQISQPIQNSTPGSNPPPMQQYLPLMENISDDEIPF